MYKRLGLFLLIVVLMISAIPTTLADSPCDFTYSNYARAVQLHDMKDYTRSLAHYDCALQQDPDNLTLLTLIGNVYRDMGDLPTAQTYYARAEQQIDTPSTTLCDASLSHFEKGVEYYYQGDFAQAFIHLDCALQDNADDPELLRMLGDMHANLGDIRTARHYHDQSYHLLRDTNTTCDPTISHYARGVQLHGMGDYTRALEHYHCALEKTPERSTLLKVTGDVYRELGDLQTAQDYYDRAGVDMTVFVDGCDTSISQFANGSRLHSMGDLGRALESYHCALNQDPDRVVLMVQIAQVYMQIEDYDPAMMYLNRALQVDDQNAVLYSMRGYVHYRQDNFPQALLDLNVALELHPDLPSAIQIREMVFDAMGQADVVSVASPVSKNALPQLDDTVNGLPALVLVTEAEPTSPTAQTLRQSADTFFNQVEFDLAIEQYQALLGFEPNNVEAHFRIGYAYYALENPADAAIYLQQALDFDPDHLYAQYLLAMSYSMLDVPYKSLNILSNLYLQGRHDSAYPIALGHVFRNMGQTDDAGIEFYKWIQAHELVRMQIDAPQDITPIDLVMDYGVVYEIPFRAMAGSPIDVAVESHILNRLPIDPLLVILDADGNPISGDDDHGALFDATLNFVPTTTGDYTLLVSHAGGKHTGDLVLTMSGQIIPVELPSAQVEPQLEEGPGTYTFMARSYHKDGYLFSAANYYLKALKAEPLSHNVRCELGMIFSQWGNHLRALDEFEFILAHDANHPCAKEQHVVTFTEMTRPTIPDNPFKAEISEVDRLRTHGVYSTANNFLKALKADPMMHDVRCELGLIFTNWGNHLRALDEFEFILLHDSNHPCATQQREAVLIEMERTTIPDNKLPDNPGKLYQTQGHLYSAVNTYIMTLKADPTLDDMRCELGAIYLSWGNYLSAMEHFDIIIANNPTHDCAVTNREIAVEKMRRFYAQFTNSDSLIVELVATDSDTEVSMSEVDALYDVSMSMGVKALMYEAQVRHEQGDIWMASALIDRYLDEEYTTVCSGELRWLAMEYRDQGYTVAGDMMHLKSIGDTTC